MFELFISFVIDESMTILSDSGIDSKMSTKRYGELYSFHWDYRPYLQGNKM